MANLFGLFFLAACLAIGVGAEERVIGAPCGSGTSSGTYCEQRSACDGPVATRSDRCPPGFTPPSPTPIVCCRPQSASPSSTTSPSRTASRRARPAFLWTPKPKNPAKSSVTPSAAGKRLSHPPLVSQAEAKRIVRKKCVEYNKYVYSVTNAHTLVPGSAHHNSTKCAEAGRALIAGGVAAAPREFPHMVALGYSSDDGDILWSCGGSLISENFVLTAAHCLGHGKLGPVKWALLGKVDLQDRRATKISVVERIIHPDYVYRKYYDDIGLLRLQMKLKLSFRIRPACIGIEPLATVPRDTPQGPVVYVTGWGLNQTGTSFKTNVLMKVDLYAAPFERCDEEFAFLTNFSSKLTKGIVRDSMLCIANNDTRKESCQGDSGGPVQRKIESGDFTCMLEVLGVTSFGSATCGGGLSASIYTNVEHYLPWIISHVWPDAQNEVRSFPE